MDKDYDGNDDNDGSKVRVELQAKRAELQGEVVSAARRGWMGQISISATARNTR